MHGLFNAILLLAFIGLLRALHNPERLPPVTALRPHEMNTAATYLCGIFLEEGYINPGSQNLQKHIALTEKEFEDSQQNALKLDDYRVQFLKIALPTQHQEWVAFGQVITDNAKPRRAVIQNLCVSRKHRRRGLGKALVERAMSTVKDDWKHSELWLNVEDDNKKAISFYTKLGFQKDESEGPGFGSFMMVKRL